MVLIFLSIRSGCASASYKVTVVLKRGGVLPSPPRSATNIIQSTTLCVKRNKKHRGVHRRNKEADHDDLLQKVNHWVFSHQKPEEQSAPSMSFHCRLRLQEPWEMKEIICAIQHQLLFYLIILTSNNDYLCNLHLYITFVKSQKLCN